jgi:glycine betaine catabolism A
MTSPVESSALASVLDPGGPGCMLPAAAYLDDVVLAWERTNLFGRAWACAGRSGDLAAPGDRRAVSVGDNAVLLVRGDDGALRCFFDVCQHRAHELLPCGAVAAGRAIQCPYHGWRYAIDGSLLSTPHFAAPSSFDRDRHGLVPARVEEWHGWAMVDVSADGPPLAEFFDGVEPHVADHEPERLVVGASHTYEVAANWKLVTENFHECLHCPQIHPELCAVSPSTSGRNHVGHRGFWVGGWMDLMPHAATMSLSGASPTVPLPRLAPAARRRVDYVGLLPNLLVSLHPDYVMTHRLEPLAPDRTAIECQWLFSPEAGLDPSFAVDFWDLTNRQDWAACESVQRGVASRGYRPGPFSSTEDAVAQFVRLVASAYLAGGWTRSPANDSGGSATSRSSALRDHST